MIYFIRSGKSDSVKIGFSDKGAKSRLSTLQTGNPEKLNIEVVVRGGRNLEGSLHRILYFRKIIGEWFRLSQQEVVACTTMIGPKEPKHVPGRNQTFQSWFAEMVASYLENVHHDDLGYEMYKLLQHLSVLPGDYRWDNQNPLVKGVVGINEILGDTARLLYEDYKAYCDYNDRERDKAAQERIIYDRWVNNALKIVDDGFEPYCIDVEGMKAMVERNDGWNRYSDSIFDSLERLVNKSAHVSRQCNDEGKRRLLPARQPGSVVQNTPK